MSEASETPSTRLETLRAAQVEIAERGASLHREQIVLEQRLIAARRQLQERQEDAANGDQEAREELSGLRVACAKIEIELQDVASFSSIQLVKMQECLSAQGEMAREIQADEIASLRAQFTDTDRQFRQQAEEIEFTWAELSRLSAEIQRRRGVVPASQTRLWGRDPHVIAAQPRVFQRAG